MFSKNPELILTPLQNFNFPKPTARERFTPQCYLKSAQSYEAAGHTTTFLPLLPFPSPLAPSPSLSRNAPDWLPPNIQLGSWGGLSGRCGTERGGKGAGGTEKAGGARGAEITLSGVALLAEDPPCDNSNARQNPPISYTLLISPKLFKQSWNPLGFGIFLTRWNSVRESAYNLIFRCNRLNGCISRNRILTHSLTNSITLSSFRIEGIEQIEQIYQIERIYQIEQIKKIEQIEHIEKIKKI